MTQCRLAMLDVDGTLMHLADWRPETGELLDRLAAAGLAIALCSGRAVDSLQASAEEWPQIGFLAGGGGSVVQRRGPDGWSTVGERFLPADQVVTVADAAASAGMEVWAFTNEAWIVAERTDRVAFDESFTGATPTVAPFLGRHDIVKLLTFVENEEQAAVLDAAARLNGVSVVSSYPGYWDVVPEVTAQTKGGDMLTAELGIGWPEVLALGDGLNDLGMLSRAGTALLMPPRTVAELDPPRPGQERRALTGLRDALAALDDRGW